MYHMKKWLFVLLAVVFFAFVHEGAHAFTAFAYKEYESFHVRPIGLEVVFKTPISERNGVKWGIISGSGNLLTLAIGYLLLAFRQRISRLQNVFARSMGYWIILLFLIGDALNLSIGTFLYGGDANGIAVGFNISRYTVQLIFLVLFVINRELVAQMLLPTFGITTSHPLFRPWMKITPNTIHERP